MSFSNGFVMSQSKMAMLVVLGTIGRVVSYDNVYKIEKGGIIVSK